VAALKGAFIKLGEGVASALADIVVFQFNPDRMTRTPALVRPPTTRDGSGRADTLAQPDQANESYSFTLRLDATDQLARGNPLAASSGILPTLSALELLMVARAPSTAAPAAVTISSLSIVETQYDTRLNPVRAEVTVSVQVLTPSQLPDSAIARGAYEYSVGVKRAMAALNVANAVDIGVSSTLSFTL
jgi:hypothetical protein